MKKIIFSCLLASFALFASAKSEVVKTTVFSHEIQLLKTSGFISYIVEYHCGDLVSTVCCFNTYEDAAAYLNSHPASVVCKTLAQP